jgi:hypothetical protein
MAYSFSSTVWQGFFFSILWCSSSGLLYIIWCRQIWLQTRYESRPKKGILLYSWLPTGTYHKNLVIWKNNNNLKSTEFEPFFHGKSFVYVEIIFFRSKFGEIWPPKKHCCMGEAFQNTGKVLQSKKPTVLWGTPVSDSLWISGSFPGVRGITGNFLAAHEFSCKGICTIHSNASDPLRSLQPRVLHKGMHCQQCLPPETSDSARGSWVRSHWQQCLPLYWTPTTAGVSFFKMPCSLGLYHPCNCGMDGNALQPGALPYTP